MSYIITKIKIEAATLLKHCILSRTSSKLLITPLPNDNLHWSPTSREPLRAELGELAAAPVSSGKWSNQFRYVCTWLSGYVSSKRRTYIKTSSNLEPCGNRSESPIPKLHRLSMVFPLRMVDSQSFFPEISTNETSIYYLRKKYHEIKSIYKLKQKDLSY